MRDLVFTELRERTRELAGTEEENTQLAEQVAQLLKLSRLGREEGLLALEEAAYRLKGDSSYFKDQIMLVVDGTDPELIEELGLIQYFASGSKGSEALKMLMQLHGMLSIQAGENPLLVERKLLAFLPKEAKLLYESWRDRQEMQAEIGMPQEPLDPAKYYTGEIAVGPEDDAYYLVKVTDEILRDMPDSSMQRLLRDVENADMELAMRVISGKARERIFCNLSAHLSSMIVFDLDHMGTVRLQDAAEAVYKMLLVFLKLNNAGEVICGESRLAQAFAELFQANEEQKGQVVTAENRLRNIASEYSRHADRVLPRFSK